MQSSKRYTSVLHFFKKDSAAGLMLLLATVAALVIANSPLNKWYEHLLELEFTIGLSFTDPTLLEFTKVGILIGSLVSGVLGYLVLSRRPDFEAEEQEPFDLSEQKQVQTEP